MFEQNHLPHHIQKHIVGILMYQKYARFRDLRPPRTDTNLFTYHLKVLQRIGMVDKTDHGYTLSQNGLTYVDRVSTEKLSIRSQPKIITMLVVQNSNGDVLLQKRTKQPYIDTWTLPYGKLHINDESTTRAADREAYEKLELTDITVKHAGDCYIRVYQNDEIVSSTLAHIFSLESDDITETDQLKWTRPHKLSDYNLAPAVEQIVTRTFFRDPYFFEEFDVDW